MNAQHTPGTTAQAIAFIALGSNLEEPQKQVHHGFDELDSLPNTRLLARSSLYLSAPMGYADQPDFVNAVAKLETMLSPRQLLEALLGIELKHGRKRSMPNAPRTLDLDILLYADLQHEAADLIIPHPRMHTRAFVLLPLAEIAPDCEIPGKGLAKNWLPQVDQQQIKKLSIGK
jgi:2-amino-4-hydroxy-6-hydroxymethyldihydropteridine diphosphokinase